MSELGDLSGVLTTDSGDTFIIGEVIGMAADPDAPCDAPDGGSYMFSGGVIRCRCVVCPRCRHHTGNAHQGHYWGFCKATKTIREFHLCCPDPEFGCALERPHDPAAAGGDRRGHRDVVVDGVPGILRSSQPGHHASPRADGRQAAAVLPLGPRPARLHRRR